MSVHQSRSLPLAIVVLSNVLLHATAIAAGGEPQKAPASKPVGAGTQGKIVLIQGHVDSAVAAAQEKWDPATLFQPLFVSDRVRTLAASRSAILFIDETQVKLNAGAVLTVQQIKGAGGTSTTLGLLEGEGWFRTKNPASGLTIRTPTAAAAIRGTEINVAIRGRDTVLTVTEGAAEFSNDAGSLVVTAGEEATATPGQAPTKRTLLNPEDAVQWVLYYPARVAWHDLPAAAQASPARAGFDRLKAGDAAGAVAAFQPTLATDPWSRIGAAAAYRQLGDTTRARTVLMEATATGAAEIERRAELAAAALAVGDARTARTEIAAALAIEPTALRPLAMLSELELTQNRKDQAVAAARRAVAAHPQSVAAHVAAAEAAQAAFDLDAARRELDAALAIDPTDVRALVDRARVRFGVGDTPGARQDADRAAAVTPDDAQVRSLLGFIKMSEGALAGARADFDAAVAVDAALGEPHLGLGLLDFQDERPDDGLLEMLTATLLEPKVSLYQSYLGKTYYQLARFPEGLAALASAKRLDPHDPTPWLYTSMFLRDQNRQIQALDELRHAIALNDNRAVYRSRLLLDRDLATKNVSLAQLYNQLGFEAWGASEALNSLNADLTNASAHQFIGDAYSNLPDRSQALGSEILQFFLYAPVNANAFNTFSEYTALLDHPLQEALLTVGGGDRGYGSGTVATRSGNQRFAYQAFLDYYRREGSRPDAADSRAQGTALAKVALGRSSDMFFTATGVVATRGQDNDVSVTIGAVPLAVNVTEILQTPDPTFTHQGSLLELTSGFKHLWKPGSAFTAAADYTYQGNQDDNPDALAEVCSGADLTPFFAQSDSRVTYPFQGFSLQAQQATRVGRHQILVGADFSRKRKGFGCHDLVTSPLFPGYVVARADQETEAFEHAAGAYVRDDIELTHRLHVTIGARYVDGLYGDLQQQFSDFTFGRWNPYAGVSLRLSRVTTVHAAAFRNTNGDFISSSIAPPTVAGFGLDRNELPTAQRDEGGLDVQNAWSRSFLEVRGFVRRTVAPAFQRPIEGLEQYTRFLTPPDADFRAKGVSAFFNQILGRQVSVFADEQFERRHAFLFDRDDQQLRIGVNYVHPRGVFARVSTRLLHQRFFNTLVEGLPDSSFALTDAEFKYEFAAKRGLLTWTITNLFDRAFQAVIEGLTVEPPLPHRTVVLKLRWRI